MWLLIITNKTIDEICNCNIKIVHSYRIEQAMEIPQNIDFKNEIVICKEIIYAVDIHRKAIKLVPIKNKYICICVFVCIRM